jgi:hypothetical protein
MRSLHGRHFMLRSRRSAFFLTVTMVTQALFCLTSSSMAADAAPAPDAANTDTSNRNRGPCELTASAEASALVSAGARATEAERLAPAPGTEWLHDATAQAVLTPLSEALNRDPGYQTTVVDFANRRLVVLSEPGASLTADSLATIQWASAAVPIAQQNGVTCSTPPAKRASQLARRRSLSS